MEHNTQNTSRVSHDKRRTRAVDVVEISQHVVVRPHLVQLLIVVAKHLKLEKPFIGESLFSKD